MKKIIFSLVVMVASTTCFAQKWSVHHFEVSPAGIATIYLTNDKGETMVKNIKAIVNPKYNQQGKLTGGATEGRQGLMLNPPIKPASWEKDNSGNWGPVGFSYNIGFESRRCTVYIVEGDGVHYDGREQECDTNAYNPGDWVLNYSYNTYQIPNFCQVVTVRKDMGTMSYSAR